MRVWTFIVAASLVTIGFGAGTWRVVALEREELETASRWTRLQPTPAGDGSEKLLPHRELGRVSLREGETVTFEVCARDPLRASRWADQGVELAVWIPATGKVVARVPVDRQRLEGGAITRGPEAACLIVADGSGLEEGGEYAVEAVWPAAGLSAPLDQVMFRVQVAAFMPSRASDRVPVMLIFLGALALVAALASSAVDASESAAELATASEIDFRATRGRTTPKVIIAMSALLTAQLLLAFVQAGSSLWVIARALLLAMVQLALVLALFRGTGEVNATGWAALGLEKPDRWQRAVWVIAPLVGIALWLLGQVLIRLIPATGVSPVGVIVSWPSGSLAVALVSVVLPLVEEVFFRGFLFGALSRAHGHLVAFATTVVLFAGVHVPQTWGAWGGLASVTLTGVGLTWLRLRTGSTLAPMLAHLVHNSAILFGWVFI